MSLLKANVEALNTAKTELEKVLVGLDEVKPELEAVLSEIDTEWLGLSAIGFKLLFCMDVSGIKDISASVDELKQYAENAGNTLKLLDNILNFMETITVLPKSN